MLSVLLLLFVDAQIVVVLRLERNNTPCLFVREEQPGEEFEEDTGAVALEEKYLRSQRGDHCAGCAMSVKIFVGECACAPQWSA